MTELFARIRQDTRQYSGATLGACSAGLLPGKIDKSQLAIAEPKRLRDRAHLEFVASHLAWFAGGNPPIPITFGLRNRGLSVLRSATSSLCRYAEVITDNCTRLAMK